MPRFDLPSAIAASTSSSRAVRTATDLHAWDGAQHPGDHLGVERAAAGCGDPGRSASTKAATSPTRSFSR